MPSATARHIIVGTAGHIDHGKSALVEALTGTHPDRLPEEKRRGITIELGFAFLDHAGVRFGFVDVPGHERFVGTMLAGAGGMDMVLLIIAADEGIKPQTREHFDICRLLEIPRGLVVITKSDLADADQLALVTLETEEFLRGSFLAGAPVVPVSAKTGAGLDALRAAMLQVARDVPSRDSRQHARLPIDRAFAVKGFGTVVTGTLVSGSIAPEDELELFPVRRRVRVRGVQSGGHAEARAVAGQRTAVNLASLDLAGVRRGMTLASPGWFACTKRVDARVTLLPSARPLKSRAKVHFHQGTAECLAEVVLLGAKHLAPGENSFAQLRLAEEMFLLPGDRFILRQFSPLATIGGGVALDTHPPRAKQAEADVRARMEAFSRGAPAEILLARVEAEAKQRRRSTPLAGLTLRQIVARTGWLPDIARVVAGELASAGRARILAADSAAPDEFRVVSARAFGELTARLQREVEAHHAQNPLLPGISREDLRARVAGTDRAASRRPDVDAVFAAALGELVASRILELDGELVRRAGRSVTMTSDEARARQQIEAAFADAGLAVPPVAEVLAKLPVEKVRAEKILQLLLREGVLVRVTQELIFHRDALARLRELLAGYKRDRGPRISVPAFKQLAGITRKYAIPLLEYLDRSGVTRRAGDERVIL